jgi:hypothetical protein
MQVNGLYFSQEDIVKILQEKSSQYSLPPPVFYYSAPVQMMHSYSQPPPQSQSLKRSYDDFYEHDKRDNKRVRQESEERQDQLRNTSAAILSSVSVLDGIIPSISYEDTYKFLLNKLGWNDVINYDAHIKKYVDTYATSDDCLISIKKGMMKKIYNTGSNISVVVLKKKGMIVVKTCLFINLSEYETHRGILISDLFNEYFKTNILKLKYVVWSLAISEDYNRRCPLRNIIRSFKDDIKDRDGYLLTIISEIQKI